MHLKEIFLNERIAIHSMDEYLELVCRAYESAPDYTASDVHYWNALKQDDDKWFDRISSKIKIIPVPGDPYASYEEMKHDVEKNKTLKVSEDFNEHPVFSYEDNIKFRVVHDYAQHILPNNSFGIKEINAYNSALKLFSKEAVPALFTEIVGQAAVAITKGVFPKQKISVLKGFDYYNIGRVTEEFYSIHGHDKIQKLAHTLH